MFVPALEIVSDREYAAWLLNGAGKASSCLSVRIIYEIGLQIRVLGPCKEICIYNKVF